MPAPPEAFFKVTASMAKRKRKKPKRRLRKPRTKRKMAIKKNLP